MNGLGFLGVIVIGAVIGALRVTLRRGGLLDTRTCLDVGHVEARDQHGLCPRCGMRPRGEKQAKRLRAVAS